jgi:MFS family permease
MALGFCGSVVCFVAAYFSGRFVPLCIMAAAASFLNCAGNTIFNASMMVALPEENRGAILGFINSASVGGTALSAVIYGFLGELFPLYLVFAAGYVLGLVPMLYMCFHPATKAFVLEH